MEENFIPLLTGIIFLVIGIICLCWPKKIQEHGLKWSNQGLGRFNPFLGWMKTPAYILTLRIIGVVGVAISFLAFEIG